MPPTLDTNFNDNVSVPDLIRKIRIIGSQGGDPSSSGPTPSPTPSSNSSETSVPEILSGAIAPQPKTNVPLPPEPSLANITKPPIVTAPVRKQLQANQVQRQLDADTIAPPPEIAQAAITPPVTPPLPSELRNAIAQQGKEDQGEGAKKGFNKFQAALAKIRPFLPAAGAIAGGLEAAGDPTHPPVVAENLMKAEQAAAERGIEQEKVGIAQQQANTEAEYKRGILNQYGLVPVQDASGNTIYIQQKDLGRYAGTQVAAKSRENVAQTNKRFAAVPGVGLYDTQTRQLIPGTEQGIAITPEIAQDYGLPQQFVGKPLKVTDLARLEDVQTRNLVPVQGAEGPAIANKKEGTAKSLGLGSPAANPIASARLSLEQQRFERDTFGTLFGKAIPSSLVDAQGNTLGWKSPAMPTATIKTQAQQAEDLSSLFQTVRAKIVQADKAGLLGPYQGRISELMTGQIGADDPQFAELRALGSLAMSGVLKAHFGARGGTQMYSKFESEFNTGRMTEGDLLGALNAFQTFMDKYAERVHTAGQNKSQGSKTFDVTDPRGVVHHFPTQAAANNFKKLANIQ